MDTLFRFVFLWISFGILVSQERFEACSNKNFPDVCKFVFKNICFEFVWESKPWSQAGNSCEMRGGKLLNVITSPMKIMLENITRDRNISNFSWWLGEGVLKMTQGTAAGELHLKAVRKFQFKFVYFQVVSFNKWLFYIYNARIIRTYIH